MKNSLFVRGTKQTFKLGNGDNIEFEQLSKTKDVMLSTNIDWENTAGIVLNKEKINELIDILNFYKTQLENK